MLAEAGASGPAVAQQAAPVQSLSQQPACAAAQALHGAAGILEHTSIHLHDCLPDHLKT